MEKAQVYAKHKNARISPKKVAIVMDMVRGAGLNEAKQLLSFDQTKGAKLMLKVLKSAEANAVNNQNLNPDELYVSDLFVNPGRFQKWGKAGSKGRYNPQKRRYAHISIGLSERVKSKEEKKKDKKILKKEEKKVGKKDEKKDVKKKVKKEDK